VEFDIELWQWPLIEALSAPPAFNQWKCTHISRFFRLFSQCSDKYFECFEWRAIDEEFDARNLRAFFGLIILEFLWIVGCLPAALSFQLTYINQKLPLEIVCKSVCFG